MPAASQPQSHARFPLTSILGSAGNVRMLRALAADAGPLAVPDLARRAGLTGPGARRVLDSLADQGVVKAYGSGRTRFYGLDPRHPFADGLSGLFRLERQRWEDLLAAIRDALAAPDGKTIAAWLYGSVARGDDTPGSDLDVAALVSEPEAADRLREVFIPIEDAQHVRISLTVLTPAELAALPENDPWWSDVVRDARVLKGQAPSLARRQVARAAE
jgi:predicted nucleotidyltransferase